MWKPLLLRLHDMLYLHAESKIDAYKLGGAQVNDREPSTAATTQHFPPAESEVDGVKLD